MRGSAPGRLRERVSCHQARRRGHPGAGQFDKPLAGPRLRGLDALEFRVRAQDGHFDREGRAGILVALAPHGLQRPRFGEQRLPLTPAEVSDRIVAAQARCQDLLHELVPKACAAPDRFMQPLAKLFAAEVGDLVDAAIRPHSGLLLYLRGYCPFTFHFVNDLVDITSI